MTKAVLFGAERLLIDDIVAVSRGKARVQISSDAAYRRKVFAISPGQTFGAGVALLVGSSRKPAITGLWQRHMTGQVRT